MRDFKIKNWQGTPDNKPVVYEFEALYDANQEDIDFEPQRANYFYLCFNVGGSRTVTWWMSLS